MNFRKALAALVAMMATLTAVQVVTQAPSQAAVSWFGDDHLQLRVPPEQPGRRTSVQIARCAETSMTGSACTVTKMSTEDEGNYAYYAGPRGVTGTANYCVRAYGEMDRNGTTYWINSGNRGC